MAADGLIKTLTTAKFREFKDLIGISRIAEGICYTNEPQNDETAQSNDDFDRDFDEEFDGESDGETDEKDIKMA